VSPDLSPITLLSDSGVVPFNSNLLKSNCGRSLTARLSSVDRELLLDCNADRFAIMPTFDPRVVKHSKEIMRLLMKETDRGCVLVASAYFEDSVRRMLSAFCRTVSDVSEKELNTLFKTFDSQFANFSSCIRLCRALGLIDDQDQRILNKFGVWRNQFAHGTGDKQIDPEGLASFLAPIEEMVELAVEAADIPELKEFSEERQKFMAWASISLGEWHEMILDHEDFREPHPSPDEKPQ
jgi:hypothetical protein